MLALLLACSGDVTIATPPGPEPDIVPDEVETLPNLPEVEEFFRDDVVHEREIRLSDVARDALLVEPREEVEAELVHEGARLPVGVSLKGNSSFDVLTGKPAFKADVNAGVEGQQFQGMPSFYLQNGYWDPSVMHEFLVYGFFQDHEVPAARAAYVHLNRA